MVRSLDRPTLTNFSSLGRSLRDTWGDRRPTGRRQVLGRGLSCQSCSWRSTIDVCSSTWKLTVCEKNQDFWVPYGSIWFHVLSHANARSLSLFVIFQQEPALFDMQLRLGLWCSWRPRWSCWNQRRSFVELGNPTWPAFQRLLWSSRDPTWSNRSSPGLSGCLTSQGHTSWGPKRALKASPPLSWIWASSAKLSWA